MWPFSHCNRAALVRVVFSKVCVQSEASVDHLINLVLLCSACPRVTGIRHVLDNLGVLALQADFVEGWVCEWM